jgi:hypothetical protein
LDTLFKRAGFNVQKGAILRSNGHSGHGVQIAGLEMFYKHTVKGAPPITVGFPPGVPCPIKTPSQLPVDPCSGVGMNLNAKYRGQITFGQVGALSLALPPTPTPKVPKVPSPSTPPVGHTPGGNVGPGPTNSLPGNGGAGSVPGTGTTTTGSGQGPDVAPTLAGTPQAFLDPFAGLNGRLWWFFPLIAVSLLAIAGRLRTPARLPSE